MKSARLGLLFQTIDHFGSSKFDNVLPAVALDVSCSCSGFPRTTALPSWQMHDCISFAAKRLCWPSLSAAGNGARVQVAGSSVGQVSLRWILLALAALTCTWRQEVSFLIVHCCAANACYPLDTTENMVAGRRCAPIHLGCWPVASQRLTLSSSATYFISLLLNARLVRVLLC